MTGVQTCALPIYPGLYRRALHIESSECHWVNPDEQLTVGQSRRFLVRIRYRQPLQWATMHVQQNGAYIVFDEPQRGIAAGQFAAWYLDDRVVGSGVISA